VPSRPNRRKSLLPAFGYRLRSLCSPSAADRNLLISALACCRKISDATQVVLPQECHSAQAVKAKRGGARKPFVIDRLSVMGSLLLATLIDSTLVIAATPLGANEPLLQYEG
jgi:hypothetical protein